LLHKQPKGNKNKLNKSQSSDEGWGKR
jgi:hypothetical protein